MSRAETRSGKPARKPATDPVADARAVEHLRRVPIQVAPRAWAVLSGVSVGSTYLVRGTEEVLVKLSDEVSCPVRPYARDPASIARALGTWPTRFDFEMRSPAIASILQSPDNPDLGALRGGAAKALAIFDRDSLRAYIAWTHFRVHNPNDVLVCVLAAPGSILLEG